MSDLSEENGEQSKDARTVERRIEALESAVNTLVRMYGAAIESYHALLDEFKEHRVSIEYLLSEKREVIH